MSLLDIPGLIAGFFLQFWLPVAIVGVVAMVLYVPIKYLLLNRRR